MTDENKPASNKSAKEIEWDKKLAAIPQSLSDVPGPGNSYKPEPSTNDRLPRWGKWKYMPEVEPWQACALALNFDPDSMKRSPHNWMVPEEDIFEPESFPSDEVAEEFGNLRTIVEANNLQTVYRTINLPEFAAWCSPVVCDLTGRDIPPELEALAKATQAAPKVEAAPADAPDETLAALLRESIATETDESSKEAFDGATKDEARAHLAQWEPCYMPQWGAPELVKAIVLSDTGRDEALALRAVSMAQSAKELPEAFSPKEGIQWAMARGYLIARNICAWCGVEPGIYGHPSNPYPTADAPAAKVEGKQRSITKQQVINAFEGLHLDRNGWNNALSDVPNWIEPCRVTLGRKGDRTTPATWNPVLIAVALIDKGIMRKKLDAVFVRLPDWVDEWREVSASSPD